MARPTPAPRLGSVHSPLLVSSNPLCLCLQTENITSRFWFDEGMRNNENAQYTEDQATSGQKAGKAMLGSV